jgi:hypothetical protein
MGGGGVELIYIFGGGELIYYLGGGKSFIDLDCGVLSLLRFQGEGETHAVP